MSCPFLGYNCVFIYCLHSKPSIRPKNVIHSLCADTEAHLTLYEYVGISSDLWFWLWRIDTMGAEHVKTCSFSARVKWNSGILRNKISKHEGSQRSTDRVEPWKLRWTVSFVMTALHGHEAKRPLFQLYPHSWEDVEPAESIEARFRKWIRFFWARLSYGAQSPSTVS